MEYLDTVKEKIADYIAREPVVETSDTISAYTLFSAVENCKKRLRHVEEIEKGLVDKLNSIYPQTIIKEKKGLFNKKKTLNYFDEAVHYITNTHAELKFFSDYLRRAELDKDYEYSDIYSIDKGLTQEAYDECIDEISAIFSELDYFGELYSKDTIRYSKDTIRPERGIISNKINRDGFDLEVIFDNKLDHAFFSYGIKLNKGIAPNGHADAHFYGKDNNVEKVINENMVAILKNTPVNMNELSYMFYVIVADYRRMTEQDRIDEEIDKAFQKLYEKK